MFRTPLLVFLVALLAALSSGCGSPTPPPARDATALPGARATEASDPLVESSPRGPTLPPFESPAEAPSATLVVTNSTAGHISYVDPRRGVTDRVEVGFAPWGIALAPNDRMYVSTAEGVAVVNWRERRRLALIPYRARIAARQTGEYRQGGMGIAASPDGRLAYVGVYTSGQSSQLEIVDIARGSVIASVPIGIRPFDVLISRDGRQVYTIDHDSYSVTVVDTESLQPRRIDVAPIGRGAYDKPHYAAMDPDGMLWLPVQGRSLVRLDPVSGRSVSTALSANTHQHGVALTPDGKSLLIIGTGPAGGATGGPSLTTFETQSGQQAVIPLSRLHERIAVSPDSRHAYLTGGYLLSGGWDGITIVDLATRAFSEIAVPDRPLDVVVLPQ